MDTLINNNILNKSEFWEKSKPILFKPEMVRAIIGGRKTQTRRNIDKPKAKYETNDYLYVKEPYTVLENFNDTGKDKIIFQADQDENKFQIKYKNPLFMPKKYSRILLKVNYVDIQKLQDITQDEAKKEGVQNIASFRFLWDSINGGKPGKTWNDKPFVWVIKFEVVEVLK